MCTPRTDWGQTGVGKHLKWVGTGPYVRLGCGSQYELSAFVCHDADQFRFQLSGRHTDIANVCPVNGTECVAFSTNCN